MQPCTAAPYELLDPGSRGQPVAWEPHPFYDLSGPALDSILSAAGYEALTPVDYGVRLFQFRYTTQDRGQPVEATGLIGVPAHMSTDPDKPWPVALLLHGFIGFVDACAPSADDLLGPAQAALLTAQGFLVIAPDYIGMNGMGAPSTARHAPLVGEQVALGSWDAVRAGLRLLDGDLRAEIPGGERRRDLVVWGGSQGGHAAFFVELFGPYLAPDIDVAAVVASSPAVDLRAVLSHGMQDYAVTTALSALALVGMRRWYETPDSMHGVLTNEEPYYIADTVEQVLTPSGSECEVSIEMEVTVDEVSDIYETAFADAVRQERWEDIQPWTCFVETNSVSRTAVPLLRETPTPVLAVFGTDDPLVVTDTQLDGIARLCDQGWTIDFLECQDAGHAETTLWSIPNQVAWVQDRLAGVPLPESEICQIQPAVVCDGTPLAE